MEQQRKCPGCDGTMIDGDFIIKYDVNREAGLGDVQVSARLSSSHDHHFDSSNLSLWFVHDPYLFCSDFPHTQVVNGYFVHFFAPPDLPTVPKNVMFVIDTSGSMYGTKIQQVKEQWEFLFLAAAQFLTRLNLTDTRGNDSHPATAPRGRLLWHHFVQFPE